MSVPTPEEFKHKITISWGLAVAYTIVTVMASFTIGRMLDNDKQREKLQEHLEARIDKLEQFLLDEINGCRSDQDRRFHEVIGPRLTDLENDK